MEKIEARTAFKSSCLSEIAMVTRDQVYFEENVTCEDFSVDDLLDFSDKDFEEGSFQEDEALNQEKSFNCNSSDLNLCSNDNNVVFGDLQDGGLSVPVDEMENLEWLSQIVDDSPTGLSLLCPVGSFNWNTGSFLKNRREPVTRPVVQIAKEPCFPLPVCKKPRGKRPRPNGRAIWEIGSSASVTSESSLTSNSLDGSSPRISTLLFAVPVHQGDWVFSEKPVAKKQKKKQEENGSNGSNNSSSSGTQVVRRCTHCQVQKTPQWRAGPLGPKTLCNACGVRFKSGRLFPEYRPACSPTFSQEAHSNSHRKVLEMRRKKEVVGVIETGLSPMVPSF